MAGFTYTTLKAAILNYTETDANVLTTTIVDQFIENAEFRIFYDVPIDAYRYVSEGNLAVDDNTFSALPTRSDFALYGPYLGIRWLADS